MKKTFALLLTAALLAVPAFAAPSDDDVVTTFQGVLGVYGAIFLSTMMGQTVNGAELDLDMQSGASSLVLDNVDVAALFASIGEVMDGSGDMPEVPFSGISGSFTTTADHSMKMDVVLSGGPVGKLLMEVNEEDVTVLKADGRDFRHITDILESME